MATKKKIDRGRWKFRVRLQKKIISLILIYLVGASVAGWFPVPANAQVSPVPSGLVQPIGTLIKTWESGRTDFTQAGTVNDILAYKNSFFSTPASVYYAPFPANQGITEILPSRTLYFVRMYVPAGGINQVGGWVMRAQEVRGLTPEQSETSLLCRRFPPTSPMFGYRQMSPQFGPEPPVPSGLGFRRPLIPPGVMGAASNLIS